MNGPTADWRERLDTAPMSRTQIIAVALTVLLSALDGFDVLSVTFVAPALSAEWGIGKVELGLVLSSGLAGMALGSFLIAPLADRWGRKPLVLASLVLMSVGMALSSLTATVPTLAATRALTGLGIGACISVINPLSFEFANIRRKPLAVALMAMGYPAGGLVGGLLAAALLQSAGWQAVFTCGAIATAALIPVVAWLLPESPAFLSAGRSRHALVQLNRVLARCEQPALAALPAASAQRRSNYSAIFASEQRAITTAMTAINLCAAMATYYFLSWLPQLIADAGFPPATGSKASALASIAGIVGGVMMGSLAKGAGTARLTALAMGGLGLALAGLGLAPPRLDVLLPAAAIGGFFLFGGVAGFYATLARAFPDAMRATGTGFVIGVGRVGSALGPIIAGLLFAADLGRGGVSLAFAALAILAASILLRFSTR